MDVNTDDVFVVVLGALGAVLATLLVVWLVVALLRRRRRRRELEARFGPEYDAVVGEMGRRRGHQELEHRLDEYRELDLSRVSPGDRSDYTEKWRVVQYRFVEAPGWSVREAEHLVVEVMRDRGLPVDDVDSRVAALSVADSELSARYRDAYETFRASEDGDDDIGRLHHALVAYRGVFEDLLDRPQRERSVVGSEPPTTS